MNWRVLRISDFSCAAAALELGSLLGALTAGTLADKYSRRQSIFTACGEYPFALARARPDLLSAVFCLGSALQFGAQSPNHLILGRGIGGLGVGALR